MESFDFFNQDDGDSMLLLFTNKVIDNIDACFILNEIEYPFILDMSFIRTIGDLEYKLKLYIRTVIPNKEIRNNVQLILTTTNGFEITKNSIQSIHTLVYNNILRINILFEEITNKTIGEIYKKPKYNDQDILPMFSNFHDIKLNYCRLDGYVEILYGELLYVHTIEELYDLLYKGLKNIIQSFSPDNQESIPIFVINGTVINPRSTKNIDDMLRTVGVITNGIYNEIFVNVLFSTNPDHNQTYESDYENIPYNEVDDYHNYHYGDYNDYDDYDYYDDTSFGYDDDNYYGGGVDI